MARFSHVKTFLFYDLFVFFSLLLFVLLGLRISFETGFKKCRILERKHPCLHYVAHLLVYKLFAVTLL
jgi:hypothetical protein